MDLGRPSADLLPGPRGRLLVTMAQLGRPVTVRELARYAKTSPQSALNVVNDLTETGLVRADRAGRSLMVTLNKEHLLAEPIIVMLETRHRLVDRLAGVLGGWPQLAGAWLFGSAARGDGSRESDIDLLLVAKLSTSEPAWTDVTAQLIGWVRDWTGNEAQLVEHTLDSFSQLCTTGSRLISAIRAEGLPLTPSSQVLLRSKR
ncbi:MAG: nucleotidyltransferase domain-containing protein [Acidimicrobiales bacterium]